MKRNLAAKRAAEKKSSSRAVLASNKVKCTDPPQQAKNDFVVKFGSNEFAVKEGDKYCHGLWLDKVPETAKWFVATEQRCIVRMQVVVDANVEMEPWSEDDNPFRSNLKRSIANMYKDRGALKITEEDHSFLMEEARQRTALDYNTTVYAVIEEDQEDEEDDGMSGEEESESEEDE